MWLVFDGLLEKAREGKRSAIYRLNCPSRQTQLCNGTVIGFVCSPHVITHLNLHVTGCARKNWFQLSLCFWPQLVKNKQNSPKINYFYIYFSGEKVRKQEQMNKSDGSWQTLSRFQRFLDDWMSHLEPTSTPGWEDEAPPSSVTTDLISHCISQEVKRDPVPS